MASRQKLPLLIAAASAVVVAMVPIGCKAPNYGPEVQDTSASIDGGGHVSASALVKKPRVAEGAEQLSIAEATTRARFPLRTADSSAVSTDTDVVRVLPQGSDGGEGFYVQYKKYEISQMPTNIKFNPANYTDAKFLRDIENPSSGFTRYRLVKIGPYEAAIGSEFAQYSGGELVANAPAVVTWQAPAPGGAEATYINYSILAWDMKEDKLLRLANSLVR